MHKRAFFSEGKTTYYVRGQKFFNDNGLRDGKKKAIDYCLSNFISVDEIITFDSQLECERYEHLMEMQKQELISDLRHHLSLPILPSFRNYNGDEIPELRYNADFVYKENGKNIVEDVKGASLFTDSRFEAIKQMFDYMYKDKCYIRIVIKRDGQFIEWKLGTPKKPQKLIKKQSAKIKELQKELHDKQIAENKKEREIERIKELRNKANLTKQQQKRLNELVEKYKI